MRILTAVLQAWQSQVFYLWAVSKQQGRCPPSNTPSVKSIQSTGGGFQQSFCLEYDVSTVATKLNMTDDWVSMGSSLFVQDKASPALPHTHNACMKIHTLERGRVDCRALRSSSFVFSCFAASLISLFLWKITPFKSLSQLLSHIH